MSKKFSVVDSAILGSITAPQGVPTPVEVLLKPETEAQPVKEERPQPTAEPIPTGYKLNPLYVETKTKRLQLVLKPSVYSDLKKYCKAHKISVNDFVGRTLEEVLKEK